MKIPTPSFLKIRAIALAIGFVVMCFVIGWLKNAFAEDYTWETSPCRFLKYTYSESSTNGGYYYNYSFNTATGQISREAYTLDLNLTSRGYVDYKTIFWNGTSYTAIISSTTNYITSKIVWQNIETQALQAGIGVLSYGATDPECKTCDDIKADLIAQCGGESKIIWDPVTCEGECLPEKCETAKLLYDRACEGKEGEAWHWTDISECKGECYGCESYIESFKDYCSRMGGIVNWTSYSPAECSGLTCKTPECDDPGEETFNEATIRCDELQKTLTTYLEEECRGICGCSEEEYISEKNKCGAAGMVSFSDVTCTGICGSCQDILINAKKDCEEAGGTLFNFNCEDDNGVVAGVPDWDCKGASDVIDPEEEPVATADPTPDKPEIGEGTGETPETEKEPDPDEPSSDPWLEAIKGELENQTGQNDKIIGNTDRANSLLEWIGDSIGTLNTNLGKILDELTGQGDDLGDDIGDIKDDVENLADTLDTIATGEYAGPEDEEAYSVPDHDFNERTSEFLSQMKTTGIFSLPNKIASAIPSGGSPLLEIDTGDTFGGIHQIDFSTWSTGLLALRGVFQVMGMIIAIRIVTLKR